MDELDFLNGGGAASDRIRVLDWTSHPLGPPQSWPEGLRVALSLVLNSPESMILAWSEELFFFYNDTYTPLLGPRVKTAMGAPLRDVWPDGWEQAKPIIAEAMAGSAKRYIDLPWTLDTDRGPSQTWWTFSYSRVLDGTGRPSGLFINTNETTERVISERVQREQDARNRQVLDSALDCAIVALTFEGVVTQWSAGATLMFGWTEDDMVGQPIDRIYSVEDQVFCVPQDERRMSLAAGRATEDRWYCRADGSRFWAGNSTVPLREDDTSVSGFVKILRDLSSERERQDALQATSAQLHRAQEAGGIGVFSVGIDGVLHTTPQFARLYGMPESQKGHASDYEALVIAEDKHLVSTREKRESGVAPRDVEYRIRRADTGEIRWIARKGEIERDASGNYLRFSGVARDVTQRRAMEEELRVLNALLEKQVERRTRERDQLWALSQDPFLVADEAGVWLSASPAWTRSLGWSNAELTGRTSAWMEHPDDHAKTREEVQQLADGVTTLRFENRFRTKAGDYRWFSWNAVPAEGLLFCVARDITLEKEQAETLTRAQEQLRQSQKVEAIGQLTGGVAHDFNNLLTVIRGSTELLRRPGLTDERRQRYIDAIATTADRAAKLTAQLLAFSRRQTLKPETIDVGTTIHAMRDMLETLAGARLQIVLNVAEDMHFVDVDRSQFETAIINIAANARDAMSGAGALRVTVTASDEIPAMRAHPSVPGSFVAIVLSDTGSGIDDDVLERIFEPFFTTKDIGAGTGLGLSQVFGFAKQSGGEVHVTSTPGAGSTFTLYLPRAAPDARPLPQTETDAPVNAQGGRILVVEDNPAVGRFATQALAELGYRTVLVGDGAAALNALAVAHAPFDAVFSDVMMPGISGIELRERIRATHPRLPVVLTSGYSEVLAKGEPAPRDVLQKPYSIDGLARVLARVMSGET